VCFVISLSTTALHHAVQNNNNLSVKALIESRAKLNVVNKDVRKCFHHIHFCVNYEFSLAGIKVCHCIL